MSAKTTERATTNEYRVTYTIGEVTSFVIVNGHEVGVFSSLILNGGATIVNVEEV